jgi:hypothetical protein
MTCCQAETVIDQALHEGVLQLRLQVAICIPVCCLGPLADCRLPGRVFISMNAINLVEVVGGSHCCREEICCQLQYWPGQQRQSLLQLV